MTQTVTLELPETLAQRARAEAERTHRRLEDVLLGWIDHRATPMAVETMSDEQVLAIAETEMDPGQQAELSEFLDLQREGQLAELARTRLEDLMTAYRRDLVRKARATKVAVERGLIPPLG